MSHQDSFRKGWQSEALAYYIISKFAFLDKPSSIGDDIGIDYHCTLFNKKQVRNKTNLIPTKYKFAIQIKSNKQQFELKPDQLSNLYNLHYPYFIGVVNNNKQKITFYSNDAFDYHITMKWFKTPLFIKLITEQIPLENRCFVKSNKTYLTLNEFETFSADESYEEIENKLNILKSKINLMYFNISSRFNSKYVFLDPNNSQGDQKIVRGKDSFNSIQLELRNYIQVYIKNIEWLMDIASKNNATSLYKDLENNLKFSVDYFQNYNNLSKFYVKKNEIRKIPDLKALIKQIENG